MLTERIATWLALYELADKLIGTSWRVDAKASKRAGKVLDLLAQHEHALTPSEREQARCLLHQRHGWELPSSLDSVHWQQCNCRSCQLARLTASVS